MIHDIQKSIKKQITFSNILLLRLGINISIAMQNMTESSKKNQLTMTKQSKMFSSRLEKYNNTWMIYN